jgi:hypothetical protein
MTEFFYCIVSSISRAKGMPNSDKIKYEAILGGYEEIGRKAAICLWER